MELHFEYPVTDVLNRSYTMHLGVSGRSVVVDTGISF